MTSYVTKEQLDNLAPFLAKYGDAELLVQSELHAEYLLGHSPSAGVITYSDIGVETRYTPPPGSRPPTREEQEALGLVSEDPEPSVDKFEVNEDGTVITWMGETYVLEGRLPLAGLRPSRCD